VFADLLFFKECYKVKVSCPLLATSHGKSVVGIGELSNEQYGQHAK
jgi:hypothetical protein